MSAATRAATARERADIATRAIRAGRTNSRAFADCFEMGDAAEVVRYLKDKAATDYSVREYGKRAGWYQDVPECPTCKGTGTHYENHGMGMVEPLGCDDCGGTGEDIAP